MSNLIVSENENILKQMEGESKIEYLKRLIDERTNGIYNIEYKDIFKLVFDVELSNTESRKRAYGCKMLLELIDEEMINNTTGEEILAKIEEKTKKLERERVRVQTEKVEYRKMLREDVRSEMFIDKVADRIEKFVEITPPDYKIEKVSGNRVMILNLADIHYGKSINIQDFFGNDLNLYDMDIFEERMWKLLEEVITISKKEELKYIYIINLSDSIDGMLRMSQLKSLRLGVIDSVIGFAEFMVTWINELSKYMIVDYYSVQGNHNEIRPLGSNSGDFPHENTERLINWYLEKSLENNPNAKINKCSSHQYLEIVGVKVLATHGQNEKNLENSIKDYMLSYGIKIDILLTGHLHSTHTKTIGMNGELNVEYIQCPSICGIDDYSLKLKKSAKAGALLFILEEGKGRSITYDIKLN